MHSVHKVASLTEVSLLMMVITVVLQLTAMLVTQFKMAKVKYEVK